MADKGDGSPSGTGDPTNSRPQSADAKSKFQARLGEIAKTITPEAVAERERLKQERVALSRAKQPLIGPTSSFQVRKPGPVRPGVTSGGRTRRRKKSKKTHKKRHSRRR